MKTVFVSVNGLRTRYLTAGDVCRPSLLLLHGYGSSADSFLYNIDNLSEEFFVVAPDLAGFGFSQGADLGRRSLPALVVDQLEGLLRELDLNPNIICGHSFGGSFAISLSLRLRPQPKKLIIVSSGSVFNSDEALLASLQRLEARVPETAELPDLDTFRAYTAKTCHNSSTLPEAIVYARWISASLPGASRFFLEGLESLMALESWSEFRVSTQLEEVTAQVLVICGRQDSSVLLKNVDAALPRFTNAKLVVFDQCGHSPPFERPDEFNVVVREFGTGRNSRQSR